MGHPNHPLIVVSILGESTKFGASHQHTYVDVDKGYHPFCWCFMSFKRLILPIHGRSPATKTYTWSVSSPVNSL